MKPLIGVSELAAWLGVRQSFIYDRTRRNGPEKMPFYKLGKYLRFDPVEVEAWLAERARGDRPAAGGKGALQS